MLHLQILVFISLAIGLEAGANYPPEIMFEIFLTFAFISLLPWRVCLAICYLIRQPKFRLILLSNLVEVRYLLDRNSEKGLLLDVLIPEVDHPNAKWRGGRIMTEDLDIFNHWEIGSAISVVYFRA